MIPTRVLARWGPLALAVLAIVLLWATLGTRTEQRDAARAERDQVLDVVSELTVPADATGTRVRLSTTDALAAARGMGREVAMRRSNDAETTRRTREQATRDTAADATLDRTQAANRTQAARSAPVIAALQAAKPAPSPDAARQAIADASVVPWEGWR